MNEQEINELLNETEKKMNEVMEYQKKELHKVSTGKANINMFNDIQVYYYGEKTPLIQTSTVKIVDATDIVIRPFDKNTVKDVLAGLQNSNLGLNLQNEGDQIRIKIPPMTTERRESLTKKVKEYDEQAKIKIRDIRHKELKKVRNIESISENLEKFFEESLDKKTKDFSNQIENETKLKIDSILTI